MEKKDEKLSFEDSMEKLETIVKDLERGDVKLDDAIEKYSEAMSLSKVCSDKLKKAEDAINKIVSEDGKVDDFAPLEEEQ